MSARLSPRVPGLLALASLALICGLATGQPAAAILAAPLLIFVGVGLVTAREPQLVAELDAEATRLLEGDLTHATLVLHNQSADPVELALTLERTAHIELEPEGSLTVRLEGETSVTLVFSVRPERWGAHRVGPVTVRARDRLGRPAWGLRLGRAAVLRAFPREQRLRELVSPLRTQPFLGAHVARARGAGIEFADIRPFAPGDRVRQINWRATARRNTLYVTERHPEHASDVVLLVDTFAEARQDGTGTLDAAVRAAASLARAHLARRDRVALVDFGGTVHWLEPAFGVTQLYRIIDALIASQIAFSYAWRAVESIPRRVLPPGALVLAVTPLLDERSIRLLTDLRRRGADLTVVEVSPLAHTSPGPTATDEVAYRLWRLQREALRARLRSLGIGVAPWEDDSTLGPALEEVNAFRRYTGHLASA